MADEINEETYLQHIKPLKVSDDNQPLLSPTYSGSKFSFPSMERLQDFFQGKWEGYIYSRVSNPTVRQLELLLAHMQRTEDAIAVSSGVAAITSTLLGLLSSGDHAIGFLESYSPTRKFLKTTARRFNIETSIVSLTDKKALVSAIVPGKTKVIIFESPTNPALKIADIESICEVAKKNNILTIMDNTFAGFHNHQQYPIDIYIHSLTKFAIGTGAATGGAVLAKQELLQRLRPHYIEYGAALDPRVASAILCGLKTYYIRYARQSESAMKIATALAEEPEVLRLAYPGLASHPQHLLAKKQQKDFGAVIAFDLRGGAEQLSAFVKNLRLFKLTPSLGSTDSLIAPSLLFYGGDLSSSEQEVARINAASLRLSIGLEDARDLILDLKNALKCKN